jgi:hypothetical protein
MVRLRCALLVCLLGLAAARGNTTPSSSSGKKACSSDLKGDFIFESCGAFCKAAKAASHCRYCKCRACSFCANHAPPRDVKPSFDALGQADIADRSGPSAGSFATKGRTFVGGTADDGSDSGGGSAAPPSKAKTPVKKRRKRKDLADGGDARVGKAHLQKKRMNKSKSQPGGSSALHVANELDSHGRTRCQSLIRGDFRAPPPLPSGTAVAKHLRRVAHAGYEACGSFCKASKAKNHCAPAHEPPNRMPTTIS